MGKIIALANQKGGVGKTTTTINLAASLATLEKTVLVLDADPQANASSGLGVDIKEVDCSVYECIIDHADIRDAIYTTDIEGLDIVPSHIDLVGAEIEMLNMKDREKVLKGLLQPIRDEYDYILIDCSPSLGLITVNALTAADSVIIPVQCEYFALEGISKLLNTIKIIKSKLNPKLEIEGFLLTMYDSRLRLARQIYDEVKRHFQELVFRTNATSSSPRVPATDCPSSSTMPTRRARATTCLWPKRSSNTTRKDNSCPYTRNTTATSRPTHSDADSTRSSPQNR